jgi:hypothetical protein
VGAVRRLVDLASCEPADIPSAQLRDDKARGRMGCSMIENDTETNKSVLTDRQEYMFKAAVLILCAGILALVLLSGTHETRTADQCSQDDTRTACLTPSTPYPAHPAKGALAPFAAGAADHRAGN